MFGYFRRRFVALAVQRGVLGGSQFWMVAAVVLGARWLVRRIGGDAPKTVYSEELGPGDRLLIGPAQD